MRSRKNAIQYFAILLATLGLWGCGGQNKAANEPPLTHAYRLIDAHKDDEAIAYLAAICPPDSDNDPCHVAMASAYAHKAGIRVQRFLTVVNASKNMGALQIKLDMSTTPGETSTKVDGTLAHLAALFDKLTKVMSLYTDIPVIKNEDSVYLEEAIKIMEDLHHPTETDALYRGILRAIYFKYIFAEEVIAEGDNQELGPNCTLDLPKITDTIDNLGRLLVSILDDLILANPKREKVLTASKNLIASDTMALSSAVSDTTVLDEAGNLYLKQLVIEHGFGKLLKCKGEQATP